MTLYSGDPSARAEYMNQLAMSAMLEDRTLQAVKLNVRTGQSMSQPTDMRTLEEKFADSTLLKTRVRSDLLTITDASNTNAIIGSLGPAELKYVAQNFEELAKEIRPKYKMGILEADFMNLLQAYIAADALAPVAGRPVSAADLHAASELAPTRAQINRMGHLIQTTADANGPGASASRASPLRPTQAESVARAESLGIPSRRIGSDGRRSGRTYSTEHLQAEIARKIAEDEAVGISPSDPSSHAFWASPSPARELVYSPPPAKKTNPPSTAPARMAAKGPHRMSGRGVHRTPLGRYTICERSLGDNIIKIRSQKGAVVARYPTEKVSPKIGSLLRKMVSGGSLQFEDIQDLDSSEKRYLHKVAVGCDLTDKCPISAPRDDEAAIEMDLFTKLRGEIVAGNTNEQLIKDFKHLLYKLKVQGSLPSSQVNRVMIDLLSLGL
jgi:hypothetical protein